jgi:hypothetical protein
MGKIEDNKVTMEVQGDNDRLFRLELVLDGDHLKGDLTGTHEGETIKGKLDVSRVK